MDKDNNKLRMTVDPNKTGELEIELRIVKIKGLILVLV